MNPEQPTGKAGPPVGFTNQAETAADLQSIEKSSGNISSGDGVSVWGSGGGDESVSLSVCSSLSIEDPSAKWRRR